MLTYILKASAELKNVTGVQPLDTADYPFDYKFNVRCTACRINHDKPIEVNQLGCFEETGFRRTANFKFKCRDCKRERYVTIFRSKKSIDGGPDPVEILKINTVGVELLEFIPDDQFMCNSTLSNEEIREIDLSDNEWFDYDEKGKGEVVIRNVKWILEYGR
jgi:hypothetical protein